MYSFLIFFRLLLWFLLLTTTTTRLPHTTATAIPWVSLTERKKKVLNADSLYRYFHDLRPSSTMEIRQDNVFFLLFFSSFLIFFSLSLLQMFVDRYVSFFCGWKTLSIMLTQVCSSSQKIGGFKCSWSVVVKIHAIFEIFFSPTFSLLSLL